MTTNMLEMLVLFGCFFYLDGRAGRIYIRRDDILPFTNVIAESEQVQSNERIIYAADCDGWLLPTLPVDGIRRMLKRNFRNLCPTYFEEACRWKVIMTTCKQ